MGLAFWRVRQEEQVRKAAAEAGESISADTSPSPLEALEQVVPPSPAPEPEPAVEPDPEPDTEVEAERHRAIEQIRAKTAGTEGHSRKPRSSHHHR